MGIKVNPKHNVNIILHKKWETASKEDVQDAVISASEKPVTDTIQINSQIPEWADIEKSDGKIGYFRQGNTGDCWLLATLIAIKEAGAEARFITPRIKKEKGKLIISWGAGKEQKQYTFTQQDIKERILKPKETIIEHTVAREGEAFKDIIKEHNDDRLTQQLIKRLIELNKLKEKDVPKAQGGKVLQVPYIFGQLSSGDIDVMAIEMAHEKSIGKEIRGDYTSTAMQNVVGRPITTITLADNSATTGNEKASVDEAKSLWNLFNYALSKKNNLAIIAVSKRELKNKKLGISNIHALVIDLKRSNKDKVFLIDPQCYIEADKVEKTADGKEKKQKVLYEKMISWKDFNENFSRVSIADLSDYESYTVKSGDNLSKIAKQYGLNVQDLMLANPTLKNIDNIKIGMKLNIPVNK